MPDENSGEILYPYMVDRNVDYLQFSAPFLEKKMIEKQFEVIPSVKFYKRGYRDELGIRYYFGNNNPKVKTVLTILSGATLENMRNGEKSDAEILQWVIEAGGKITRLDLAVTEWITSRLVTVQMIERWYRKQLIDSNLVRYGARTIVGYPAENSQRQIETFYVGDMEKRGDIGIFRAYDKGLELDIGLYLSTRLELELRGKSANATANRIAKTGDIAGNFRAKFNVRHQEFDRIMDADIVETSRGKAQKNSDRKEELDKRWDWLMSQVAPSLAQSILDDRKMGLGDHRLTEFMIRAGILDEMARGADLAAKQRFYDLLYRNGVDISR